MEEEYDKFYNHLKEYCFSKGIGEFDGLTNQEITNLEKQVDIKIPLALKKYLKYFGDDIRMPDYSILKVTRRSIIEAEKQSKEKQIRKIIHNLKVVNEWNHTLVDETINDLCFINWVPYNGYFSFIKINDKYSNIYGFDNNNTLYKWENNIHGNIRKQIMFSLIRKVRRNAEIDLKKNPLLAMFKNQQISEDRKMTENVRNYNNEVLKYELESRTLINLKKYLSDYINQRMNSGI